MANWDILNKDFDSALENISESEWVYWAKFRLQKKEVRRELLEIKAKIHSAKLELNSRKTMCDNDFVSMVVHNAPIVNFDMDTKRHIVEQSKKDYTPPLAA